MRRDRNLSWDNGFPYDVLSEFGISPFSNMRTVQDVEFAIPPDRIAETRNAVAALDEVRNRLFVDFFLYWGPVNAAETGSDHA